MSLLSIVVPAYNEEDSLNYVLPALDAVLLPEGIQYEVIFIDDGSKDKSFELIRSIASRNQHVRGYRFSRNFGKEAAIWAGLEQTRGECCIVMDSDLQHPPELIPEMYRLWQEGYEVVEGVKASRGKESLLYKTFSGIFYSIISKLSGLDMKTSSDFKLLDKRVVGEILKLRERNTFFRGLSFWVGFRSIQTEYSVSPRKHGMTKWSYFSLTKYAINNVTGFSTTPLQFVTFLGVVLIIGSFVLGIQTLINFILGNARTGFTTVIILQLLVGGAIMVSLGIIGWYIAKIYDEVKGRPRFIINETTEDTLA